jgi:hypothetical protein
MNIRTLGFFILSATILALTASCAVVSNNQYKVETSAEQGVNVSSLGAHDLDNGVLKADLDRPSAQAYFSVAQNAHDKVRLKFELYNHNKFLWMAAANAGRLIIDGQMIALTGGSTNADRKVELQALNGGTYPDKFFEISSQNEDKAFKLRASSNLSVSATEDANFTIDRSTGERICKGANVQIQVWNKAGEYCTFVFPAALKEHLATFLASN